jgi:hypothetical protein
MSGPAISATEYVFPGTLFKSISGSFKGTIFHWLEISNNNKKIEAESQPFLNMKLWLGLEHPQTSQSVEVVGACPTIRFVPKLQLLTTFNGGKLRKYR